MVQYNNKQAVQQAVTPEGLNKMELITEIENYVIRTMQNGAVATPQEIAILHTMIGILLKEKNVNK